MGLRFEHLCVSFYILGVFLQHQWAWTRHHRATQDLAPKCALGESKWHLRSTSKITWRVVGGEWEESRNKAGHVFITVEARGWLSPRLSVLSYFCTCVKFSITQNKLSAVWTVKLTHHFLWLYPSLDTCSLVWGFLLVIKLNIRFTEEFSHFPRNLLLCWVSAHSRHSSTEEDTFRNLLFHENKKLKSFFSL